MIYSSHEHKAYVATMSVITIVLPKLSIFDCCDKLGSVARDSIQLSVYHNYV